MRYAAIKQKLFRSVYATKVHIYFGNLHIFWENIMKPLKKNPAERGRALFNRYCIQYSKRNHW